MNWRLFLLFFSASLACLFLLFSPVVSTPYVTHDSVRFFHKFFNSDSSASIYIQRQWLYDLGRPIAGETESFVFRHVNHLSDLSLARTAAVFLMALSAALLATILASRGMAAVPAFCLSVITFSLPGIQEAVFIPYLYHSVAVLLAMLAYSVWCSRWHAALRLIAAPLLLLAAFCTYSPIAFLFLLPAAAAAILDSDWPSTKRILRSDILLCILTFALYLLLVKYLLYKSANLTTAYQADFAAGHIWQRSIEFLTQGLPIMFNLWQDAPASFVGGILAVFLPLAWLVQNVRRKDSTLQRLLPIIAILLFINITWFISKTGPYLRLFTASQAIIVMLLFWCGKRIVQKFGKESEAFHASWPIGLMLVTMLSAHAATSNNVWNANAELMFVRSRLLPHINSSIQEIRIIQPKNDHRQYNGSPLANDEYNRTTGNFDYEVPDLVRTALQGLFSPTEMHCNVNVVPYGTRQPWAGPDTIVADLNDLMLIADWPGRRKHAADGS
ncbi:MAG: hypothetical protein HGA80_09495 [Candidatus Omnitrophica bacterium]|nr:hypothetical protein [Candidatus Omnitrophota bacterium]